MIKRVISYLLILTTLLSVFCLPITAENTNETDIAASSLHDTAVADSKNASLPEVVTVAEEIKEKRGRFEKHYLLSDGTFMAISYAEAVHEQDEDGVWQEIDNTLSYDSKSGSYKTTGKSFTAEFSTESSAAKLKDKSGNELSWHYELIGSDDEKAVMKLQKENAKLQNKTVKTAVGKAVSDLSAFEMPNAKGELRFDSAFAAYRADVRYTVSSEKIKEDVILHEKGKVYALKMVVENCAYKAGMNGDF